MTTANAARPEDEGDAPAWTTACPHDGPVPHRVLIVDDDRAIRESLARALELEGYDVDVVVDGVAALARTRRETFDALVVDVMMPGVDGLGVCRVLRADGDRTPVLMLTARVETPDRVAGLDAGADDYLPKPFELDELLARLRALLRRAAPAPEADARATPPSWSPSSGSTRPPAGPGGSRRSCSCPRPSSTSWSCWRATRASRWTTRRSTSASGATTSAPTPRPAGLHRLPAPQLAAAGAPPLIHTCRGSLHPAQTVRSARQLGAAVREHLRANLRTRFALAFATVAAAVAATVGLLSYSAAPSGSTRRSKPPSSRRPRPCRTGRPRY